MSKYRSYTYRGIMLGISAAGLTVSVCFSTVTTGRYGRGFSLLGAIVFFILLWRTVKEFFDAPMREKVGKAISRVLRVLFKPLLLLGGYFSKLFNKGTVHMGGSDEKSFFFADREKKRNVKKASKKLRYDRNFDNSGKARYYYSVFLLARIKGGYRVKSNKTPTELSRDVVRDKSEKIIFTTYNKARYMKECEIDDGTIEEIEKIIEG